MARFEELVSIENNEFEEPAPISLDVEAQTSTSISPIVAEQRAFRAKQGLSFLDSSYDEIHSSIVSGREKNLREKAAAELHTQKLLHQQKLIVDATRKKNGPLTTEEMKSLLNQDIPEGTWPIHGLRKWPVDPETVIEETYARDYIDWLDRAALGKDSFWAEAIKEIPDDVVAAKKIGRELIVKQEFSRRKLEEAEQAYGEQSWGGWTVNLLQGFIPLYFEYQLRGLLEKTPALYGFRGTNLYEQGRELALLPLGEFEKKFTAVFNTLKEKDPLLAFAFARAVHGMSSDEITLENVFSMFDIALVPGLATLGKSALRRTGLKRQAADAVKDSVRASRNPEQSSGTMAAAAGNIDEAATQRLLQTAVEDVSGRGDPFRRMWNSLPSYLRLVDDNFKANPGRLGQGVVDAVEQSEELFISSFLTRVQNLMRVKRVPLLEGFESVVKQLKDEIKVSDLVLQKAVLDVDLKYDPLLNVHYWEISLGKPGGDLFFSKQAAENYLTGAERTKSLKGAWAAPKEGHGIGWVIKVTKSIDEKNPLIQKYLIEDPSAKSPKTWISVLDWIRTPEETMSLQQRIARKKATYGPAALVEIAKKTAESLLELGKVSNRRLYKDFMRVMNAAQDIKDRVTGVSGYSFKHPSDLESFYQRHIGRLPEPLEIKAYFDVRRLLRMDLFLRNLGEVRNRHIAGAESHKFFVIDKEDKKIYSSDFDGVIRNRVPGGDNNILVVGNKAGEERLYLGGLPQQTANKLGELLTEGKIKVIELYDPKRRPFHSFGTKVESNKVEYVIIKTGNLETKPVSWQQVSEAGGVHFIYDHPLYLKQAIVIPERRISKGKEYFVHRYEGDATALALESRAVGERVGERLNQFVKLLKDGDEAGAVTFLKSSGLPWEWADLIHHFRPRLVNGIKHPPRFNLSEPFEVVARNKLISETSDALMKRYPKTFMDDTRRSLAERTRIEFTGERDVYELSSIKDEGNRNKPVFKLTKPNRIDPILAVDRGLTRIIQSTFLDDYKLKSMTQWLQEALPHLDLPGVRNREAEIARRPFFHFYNHTFMKGAPFDQIQKLKANHMKIEQLLGTPSVTDTFLHSMAQKLSDSIYKKYGPNAIKIDPAWLLPKLTDPFRFFRSATHHYKLGLFNPRQLFVQSMTFINIYSIAGPIHAVTGTYGALLHGFLRINKNPAIIDYADKLASGFRVPGIIHYKPGWFKEAWTMLENSGYGHVGLEYATLDDIVSGRVVQRGVHKVLDIGQTFFRAAEENVRRGAWYTAYLELRTKKPIGRLTDVDADWILNRADDLYNNMSRASSSIIQRGIGSWPTQFLSYQFRIAEQFLGKRLTWQERTRLVGVYFTLFGFPVAASLSGLPIADWLRKQAIEAKYVPGDSFIIDSLVDGLPAATVAAATGGHYSFAESYGIGGIEFAREFLRSDRPWWEILGGAPYSVLANTLYNANGFYRAMISLIFRDDDEVYPFKISDVVALLREVATVAGAERAYWGVYTGMWLSKKGLYLDDVTAKEAILLNLVGLTPTAINDIFLKSDLNKIRKEVQRKALDKFIQEYRKGLRMMSTNPNEASDFFRRGSYILKMSGYPEEDLPAAMSMALKGHESLVKEIDYEYYMKHLSAKDREAMIKAYQRTLRQGDIRKGQ